MRKKLAGIAVLPLLTLLTTQAQADPGDAGAGVNYNVFLQAIAGDGIVMDGRDAILQGQAICKFMAQPDGGSLWDAAQQIKSKHPNLDIGAALHFADRSVQDICPNRGSF